MSNRTVRGVLVVAALTITSCSPTGSPPADGDSAGTLSATDGTTGTENESTEPSSPSSSVQEDSAVPADVGGFNVDAMLAADPNCASNLSVEPLVIGFAADMSDSGSFGDAAAADAAVHMAKLINCSGGLAGRPVEVLVADISGDDPLAARNATKTLLSGGATVLFGPRTPDRAFRVLETTMGRVPVLFPGSTEAALGDAGRMSFLVGFTDREGAMAAAQFARAQKWSRAVTFSAPGPYFSTHPEVFATTFPAIGGTIVADFPYSPGVQLDFTEEVDQMAADPPDVVYSTMTGEQWTVLRRQLNQAGLTGVQLLATDAFEATNGYQLAPDNEGIFHVTHTDPRPESRSAALQASLASSNTGVREAPLSVAAQTADAMIVVANAYLAADAVDSFSLGKALGSIGLVDAVSTQLDYNLSGTPSRPLFVHQVVDGRAALASVMTG